MPTGSIIIVSYNSELCIEACLNALVNAEGWNVIVVDNGSQDQTVEKARGFAPKVTVISNAENKGFAGAVNQGMRATETDICVILNPDASATPRALDRLAEVLVPEDVGAAGGNLTWDGATTKGFALRRFPTLGSALSELLLLNRVWPGNPWNRRYRCLDLDYKISQEVDQPAGACLALKRRPWKELGGFDEQFFPLWFEDVDYCRRLRNHGWRILYCPKAVFLHSGGHSINRLSFADRQSYWYENQMRYFSKHHTRPELIGLRVGIVAGLLLRSILSVCGFRRDGTSLLETVSGYCQAAWQCGIRGRGLQCRYKDDSR
jgi:GT2 family glycosyltransferase